MKNHLKTFWAFALILGFAVQSYAQDSIRNSACIRQDRTVQNGSYLR